jgi:multiple sugar transport system substrate-binding protein/sn-glycerol 3-phosphate transport system substrate-binding protein
MLIAAGCVSNSIEPSPTIPSHHPTTVIAETYQRNSTNTPTSTRTLIPTKEKIPTKTIAISEATHTPVIENLDPYAAVEPSGQEIIFWHHYTKSREAVLQEIADEFNTTNEWGIILTLENQGYYKSTTEKIWSVLNTTDSPNLILVFQNQASSFQQNNSLVNIDHLMNSPVWGFPQQELLDFFPSLLSQDISPIYDNKRLGFPSFRSMDVLYYNVDWLMELGYDHPPSTPIEFQEMSCKAVQQPYSKAPGEESTGYGISMGASRVASWTFAHGGNIFNPETGLYIFSSQEVQNAMRFIQDLTNNGCGKIITEPYGDQNDFSAGKVLFTVGTSAGIPYYDQAVMQGANFRWNVAAIPHTTNQPVQNIYGVSFSIPKTNPKKELAAWLFIKYFSEPAVQAKWAETSNYFPVRKSTENHLSGYFSEYEAYKTAWDLLEFSSFEPTVPGYELVRQKTSESLAAIVNGGDISSILSTLNEEANTILFEEVFLQTP